MQEGHLRLSKDSSSSRSKSGDDEVSIEEQAIEPEISVEDVDDS